VAVSRFAWTEAGRARTDANGIAYVDVIDALYATKRLVRPADSASFAVVMARPGDDPGRPVIAVLLADADKSGGIWQILGARYLTDDETAEWGKWI
jgi:alkylation response protein AidB-like acyl-CoA dehydrogenase